jgi:hypothetical protein
VETTTETVVPEHYNPNQLVTYKVIDSNETTYPTRKVTDIEYDLDRGRYWKNQWSELSGKVARLENDLSEFLDMDAEDIVVAICDIFGFNPTKEIEFEASVTVTGTVQIPLADLKDFDIDNLNLYVNVDSYDYDISADAEVDNIITL